MKPSLFLIGIAAAGSLLAGCSSAPPAKLEASLGTYAATTTGRAYLLTLRPEQQPNSITVNVSGPGGYAETITLQSASARTPGGVWWEYGWDAGRALTSGDYTFSATVDGAAVSDTVTVDAAGLLARPAVTIGNNPTTRSVSATWNAITGANSYLARLVNRSSGAVVARAVVTGTAAGFGSLSLNAANSYAVEVYPANTNLSGAGDVPNLPNGQFNMSLGLSPDFTVTAAP